MSLKSKKKDRGIKKQLKAFKYCFDGIIYALKDEQSIATQFIISIIVIIVSFIVGLSKLEWFMVILCISLVVALELINTSIESICDMVMPDFNPLAKVAKDTAAAAVLVVSVAAVIIGLIIFIPKIF